MHVLLLPFFIIFLLIRISLFSFYLLIKRLLPHRSLIISFLVFGIALIALLTFLSNPIKESLNTNSKSELIAQKNNLENLLNKQPTHRDILLNLAKINQALGNKSQAINYKKQAQKIDPNYIFFQEK